MLYSIITDADSLVSCLQVANTPATCNYPANSFPLCTGTQPGGCNFGCDNGFFRCNGACRPNGQTCPTSAKKRDQTSARICPENWLACPIQTGKKTAWECVNVKTDLESCGGCAAIGQGTDCTALEGVDDVSVSLRVIISFIQYSLTDRPPLVFSALLVNAKPPPVSEDSLSTGPSAPGSTLSGLVGSPCSSKTPGLLSILFLYFRGLISLRTFHPLPSLLRSILLHALF